LTVSNSTFASNTAQDCGGIFNAATLLQLYNSIFTGNTNPDVYVLNGNVYAPSESHNIFHDDVHGFTPDSTDSTADPKLSVLGSYGGPTQTMIPQPGSSAICTGSASIAASAGISSDQRGNLMSLSTANASTYTGVGGYCPAGQIDIGAVQADYTLQGFTTQPSEVNALAAMSPAPAVTLNESGTKASFASSGTITVNDEDDYLSSNATPAATLSSGVATFKNLIFTTPANDDQLTATLPLNEAGTISLTASSSSFDIYSASQAELDVTGMPATAQVFGTSFTVGTSGGSGSGAVTYYGSGACSASGSTITMTSGTGTCSVYATKAASGIYSEANSLTVQVNAATATQTLSFTSGTVPANAVYNSTFTPAATSTSGLTPMITVSGGCSIASGVVTMTSGTTACVVKADQSGNTNYSAATGISQSVTASLVNQSLSFTSGTVPANAVYNSTFTPAATSTSGLTPTISVKGGCSIASGVVTMTSGTNTCIVYADQSGNKNYSAAAEIALAVVARLVNQTLSFTSGTVPASAAYNSTFTPAATSTSGLTPTITVSGGCTISGGVVTMTSGTDACLVKADQSGNTNYRVATEISQSVTASLANQSLSFTSGTVPASAAYNSTFTPAATATSGLPPTITVSGGCSISSGIVTMTSGTTACLVKVDQSGNANYSAATEISQSVTASLANQTLSFTSGTVPASAAYNSTFTPAATATSGLTPMITVSGGCSISGGVVTMTSGTTACLVKADQSGNANYSAATEISQSVTASLATTTVSWSTPTAITYGTALSATQLDAALSYNGASVAGGCTYSPGVGTVLAAGTQTLTADCTPTLTSNYSTPQKVSVSLTVNPETTTTTLSTLTPISVLSSTVTLTATVSASYGVPTGSVSFFDGSTPLGSANVNTNGVATYYATSLTTGTHSITAMYGGDTNDSTSVTGGSLSETVLDFTLTNSGSTTQVVMPGAAATYTYNFGVSSGATLPVAATVTLTGLPSGATATLTGTGWTQLSSDSWQLPANTPVGTVTLSITAPGTTASNQRDSGFGRGIAPIALGLFLLPFAGRLRRAGKRLGHRGVLLLFLAAGLLTTLGISGCGGSFFTQSQQSYNVTVSVAAGSLTHTSNVTLTVQ
jgi:hypothetical protein